MRIIAFANYKEVEYLRFQADRPPLIGVGYQCKNWLGYLPYTITEIILFGSCGLLQRFHRDACVYCIWGEEKQCSKCPYKIANDDFISPETWIMNDRMIKADQIIMPTWGNGVTIDYSCRDRNKILWEHPEAICVDQESFILAQWCKERGIKFQSVRYIIDKCGRMYPPVVNHFWRKRQHKKMQEAFLGLIQENQI